MGFRSPTGAILVALSALAATACGSEEASPLPSQGDGGLGRDANSSGSDAGVADAGDQLCGEATHACPIAPPYPGSPCEGDLDCPISGAEGAIRWDVQCVDGGWTVGCEADFPGACGPDLTEYCTDPFDGTLAGTVEVGPSGFAEFRPFLPDEQVDLEWGPQGLPMIRYALRIPEADDIGCVQIETAFTMDGMEAAGSGGTVRLRCGSSLAVLAIVPFDLYEDREFEMHGRFDVKGVGSTTASFRFRGGPR
jgi:hypothetical protein